MNKKVSVKQLLILTSALMFFYGVFMGGLQLVIVDVAATFHAEKGGMGMLVSAQHISAMFMPFLMGTLADRVGKKGVLTCFGLIFGLGCLTAGLSQSVLIYGMGMFLVGCGYSVCESQTCALLTDLDAERSARYINLTQALLCVGAIIAPPVLRFCTQNYGMRWQSFLLFCAVAFIVTSLLLSRAVFPALSKNARDHIVTADKKEKFDPFCLFSKRVFCLLFVSMIVYVGLETGFGYFVDSYFSESLFSSFGAFAISAFWAGMAICRFVCSFRSYDSCKMMIVCYALSAVLLGLLALLRSQIAALILSAAIGAAYAPIWSDVMAEAGKRFPEHSGLAAGLMSAGCAVGGISFPVCMGFIAQHFHINVAFLFLAGTAVAGCILSVLVGRK